MNCKCSHCGKVFQTDASRFNRAARIGSPLYCGIGCSGLARRVNRTAEEKRERKAEYDRNRRAELGEELKSAKRAAYYANHDTNLAKQAQVRKRPGYKEALIAYQQTDSYRAKKKEYDDQLRESEYGGFAESWRLLLALEKEIRSQQSSYERRKARGYYTRASINRRRELCRARKN